MSDYRTRRSPSRNAPENVLKLAVCSDASTALLAEMCKPLNLHDPLTVIWSCLCLLDARVRERVRVASRHCAVGAPTRRHRACFAPRGRVHPHAVCKYAPESARLAVFGLVLETVRDVPGAAVAAVASDVPFTERWHLTAWCVWSGKRRRQLCRRMLSPGSAHAPCRPAPSPPECASSRGTAPARSAPGVTAWRRYETLARQWSPVSPIGERVPLGDREWVTIIAVVGDTRQWLDQPPSPGIFLPLDVCTPVQARSGVRIALPLQISLPKSERQNSHRGGTFAWTRP